MNVYEKEIDEKEFEDQLNEIYGEVEICGMKFDSGYVLKELDPTAFRCALSDEPIVYICGNCHAEFQEDEKDQADDCCRD